MVGPPRRATNSSYFAPLRRCAPLSPGLRGAPLASATPAPLSVVLDVLVSAAPLRAGAMATAPCTGGRCLADTRVALELCMPFLLPGSPGRSQLSKVCLSSACVQGGGQNARLFVIGTRLEVDLVGAFLLTLTTVSGKSQKRTLQKWSKGGRAIAAIAVIAISIGAF